MPRPSGLPKYSLHKPSGQARVVIDGKHCYLGPHGSPESRERYLRLISERCASGQGPAAPAIPGTPYPDLSINELILRYISFADTYYVMDGQPTGEAANITDAVRGLRALYSHTRAIEFGPKALKALQRYMIDAEDLSRNVINSRINRIRRMFRWAVSDELLPSSVFEALRCVPGLRRGRCNARDTEPVRPVADAWVNATLPFLPPQVADMVRLQRWTGMRPGDVVRMRPCDIDMGRSVWIYEPCDHKTKYRGHRRLVPLGPKVQAIVRQYLNRATTAHLFSPSEVKQWRVEQRRRQPSTRKTPIYPCELRRLEAQRKARLRRQRRRAPRDHYDTTSYCRAIQYGIEKARKAGVEVPAWFPNQLRHSRATEVRKEYGLEAAQVVLGHARADVTQIYAERNLELAAKIAMMAG